MVEQQNTPQGMDEQNVTVQQSAEQTQSSSAPTATKTVEELFASGNKLLTDEGGPLQVQKDTRNLLALFSDGTFLVVDFHKYDGRVLSFEVLAKKRKLSIKPPAYVSMSFINEIYQDNEKNRSKTKYATSDISNQMQRDFVNIITKAAGLNVSDIHVVVSNHTTIMFRVDGVMNTVYEYNNEWGEAFVRTAFASADISDANYAQNEYQSAQKMGDIPLRGSDDNLMLPNNILAVRLQFNPIAFGSQYLVMRLLYANTEQDVEGDLAVLGYGKYERDKLFRMRFAPTGLCIIAGPTGSGKSTTLQRNMINMLAERNYEINLITVEDPPEYPIPGARQMPVTNATTEEEKDDAFTQALAAALRSDPDAMMVGEVRTLTAAQLTFKGALSGHNVWTTLHANSAPAVLIRLLDMGVEMFKLKDPGLMKGIVSQRLFKKVCPHCRQWLKDNPNHPTYKRIYTALGQYGIDQTPLRGTGCNKCNKRGYVGRIAVAEIIVPDGKFLELILSGRTKEAINYWLDDMHGRTLKDSAIEKMLRGLLDVEEVERWCGLLDEPPTY